MRRHCLLAAAPALAALLALVPAAQASSGFSGPAAPAGQGSSGFVHWGEPSGNELSATYDVRNRAKPTKPTDKQLDAMSQLLRRADAGTRATWDDQFGTPRTIYNYNGWLTGPHEGTPAEIARSWLDRNREVFGLTATDIDQLTVTGNHELPGTGTRIIYFSQNFNGVPSTQGGSLTVAVTEEGRVLSYAGTVVRHGELSGGFAMSPGDALENVASELAGGTDFAAKVTGKRAGYTTFARGPFAAKSYVKKVAFPMAGDIRAAYRVLFIKELDRAWDVVIDAQTGKVLYRSSLVSQESEGTVYLNFPGARKGGEPVIKSFGPTKQSPSGYVDPTGIAGIEGATTFGNNANTYANYSNFLVPADQAPRPVSATSQFNYAYGRSWHRSEGEEVPPSYAKDMEPAVTNLFWHHNRIHDYYYSLGFTESGDNFQVNNYGKGGKGHDPLLGLVHAGAATGGEPTYTGRDNAYMLTLPDGLPSWSGMFLWEPINDVFEAPYSDGNFDASVIQHEYSHGLSSRYVGTEDSSLGSFQSGAMGEGWGDWYALHYLHRKGLYDKAVVGEFVTGNSKRGIRNYAYNNHPAGYGDIGYDMVGAEVHADGEIWTTMLWEMRQALVEEYGEKGAKIAAHIVTDAMPLSPNDPSFLDMRNAILVALANRYHARSDYQQLFDLVYASAFAQNGAGLHAKTEGGNDVNPTPSFAHMNPANNGTLTGKVINASTSEPIENARVMIGIFEARVSPLRTTSATGEFSASVTDGTYPVTIKARGFGSHTFKNVQITAGETRALTFELSPNLASKANGAKVISATSGGADAIMDDTEASSWTTQEGTGHAVIKLAKPAKISSLQVSAYTSSRFEALRSFTLQVSTDGKNWKTVKAVEDAFTYKKPRPVVPDVHYRTFRLSEPVKAEYVRFYADKNMGDTLSQVQVAELQVFSGTVQKVEPAPPPPPDEPVTDKGTLAFGNPGSAAATGVTMAEFEENCSMPPASQGADGWVTKLPKSFGDGAHTVKVVGESPAPWDMDLYFYSADCERTGSAASAAADEAGTIPSGTRYILTQLWSGADVSFTLTAKDTR